MEPTASAGAEEGRARIMGSRELVVKIGLCPPPVVDRQLGHFLRLLLPNQLFFFISVWRI